jgi:hypothetical protein
MSRWTLAGIGEFVGVIYFTASTEFYGISNIGDLAHMLGVGLPFAFIGFIVGYVIDKKK